MGVCGSHFPSQRRIQTTNPSGLDGTVLQEGNEAYASREDVLPMGAQALGSSHACYQHPPSRIRNAGTTTTNVDSHTGDKSKASGDPRHHWGGPPILVIHSSEMIRIAERVSFSCAMCVCIKKSPPMMPWISGCFALIPTFVVVVPALRTLLGEC